VSWVFYTSTGVAKTGEYIGSEFPIGTVVSTGGLTAPTGWLFCDGAAVSRTTYPDLYAAIGTTYGAGDGTTTFNVPDATGNIIYAIKLATRVTSSTIGSGSTTGDAADSSYTFFMGA
jgi:microcystin-dependent protein